MLMMFDIVLFLLQTLQCVLLFLEHEKLQSDDEESEQTDSLVKTVQDILLQRTVERLNNRRNPPREPSNEYFHQNYSDDENSPQEGPSRLFHEEYDEPLLTADVAEDPYAYVEDPFRRPVLRINVHQGFYEMLRKPFEPTEAPAPPQPTNSQGLDV